ncbi:daptide-type RiPP biosynthesis methyltransferase [Massilia sp. ST3]|uniref:daptide-type RiPP biosynthesis methyltransferase n=1 Tax=Massilia sp. ST3 TaxID=2824903 RepID=UPI001B81C35D|nr:daptide-type RiPP biosynthesis methyltransferase [Massilia sp. ST3]MBQ5949411.1 class I SAM-dependent methyltransferase [Massilia sp. ST3]
MRDANEEKSGGYHGIFAKLSQLEIIDRLEGDLYDGQFADFWDRYNGNDLSDVGHLVRFLPKEGRVLDLASGSGRIGIGLARLGARVDGLELSSGMLGLARECLAAEPADVRERLRFFQGNMCEFTLEDRYDLVVLGTTSISLLLTADERRRLFECVRRHLNPGGKFVFNVVDFSGGRWKNFDHYHDVLSHEDKDGQEFVILGQRVFPDEMRFTLNVYREFVGWDGETRRSMSSSTKAWIEPEELRRHAAATGLAMVEEFHADDTHYFVTAAPGN